jgi:hypothetical protein
MAKRPKTSPYLRTVAELSEIVAELRRISSRPIAPQPDVAAAEAKLNALIDSMLPNAVDAGTGHVFDELIDAYVAEWIAAGHRHHTQVLTDLDILAAQLDAHLAGHEELAYADRLRVRDADVAHESAALRLADDDLPTRNPIRDNPVPGNPLWGSAGRTRPGRDTSTPGLDLAAPGPSSYAPTTGPSPSAPATGPGSYAPAAAPGAYPPAAGPGLPAPGVRPDTGVPYRETGA